MKSAARIDYEHAYQDIRITENRNKHQNSVIEAASRDLGNVARRNQQVVVAAIKSYVMRAK